jgi:polar amino acid transport system permease protein
MRRIVLPQAFRIVIPAIGNDFVAMMKDSSLVSILAVEELLFRAKLVGQQNFKGVEAMIIAAAMYWILTIVFSWVQQRLERRMARGDR